MTTQKGTTEDPALARKRRIELRASRSDDDASQESKRARFEDEDSEVEGERRKPSLRGIKKQARYEPGVPMTKEELAAWRKEARRVRNRESAAASRHKTKERIDILEGQVSALQGKYAAALQRIAELEGQGRGTTHQAPFIQVPQRVSPGVSPVSSPKISPAHSPVILRDSITLDGLSEAHLHHAASQMLLPSHDIHSSMISRPTAVCV